MKLSLLYFVFCIASVALRAQTTLQWSDSLLIDSTTRPITSPRIALLPDGTPLITWGISGDFGNSTSQIWCSRFENGAFTTPIGVVQAPEEPLLYGFGGYDVAVSDSQVFIVFEQQQQGIFLARSDDSGSTFGSPTLVQGTVSGGYAILSSIIVDGTGNPVVSYIQYKNGTASYEVRRSPDGGFNFEPSVMGNAPAPGGEVCECCISDLLASGDSIWLLFRNNNQNRRDIWVSRSTDLAATFDTATDVDATDWQLDFCPVAGPRMARSGDSLITVWMSAANGTSRVYLNTLHSGTMQAGFQLDFPTPSAPQTAQGQADVAAVQDTIGMVFVENSKEIVFHFSTLGAAGLPAQSTRFAVPDHTLHLPSIEFRNRVFHLVYSDPTAGQVLYRQGVLTGSSSVNAEIQQQRVVVFPNPLNLNTLLTVKMNLIQAGDVNFELQDASGKVVQTYCFPGEQSGDRVFSLKTAGLPPGVYFLRSYLGGKVLGVEKVILK
ncbi:MAG: T9SS type A sorting domain-containing protein [Saprospiraceae bacterium]